MDYSRGGITVGRRSKNLKPSNFAVEQTAGSHALAAAAHRERTAAGGSVALIRVTSLNDNPGSRA